MASVRGPMLARNRGLTMDGQSRTGWFGVLAESNGGRRGVLVSLLCLSFSPSCFDRTKYVFLCTPSFQKFPLQSELRRTNNYL
jgi:hypothetical protein